MSGERRSSVQMCVMVSGRSVFLSIRIGKDPGGKAIGFPTGVFCFADDRRNKTRRFPLYREAVQYRAGSSKTADLWKATWGNRAARRLHSGSTTTSSVEKCPASTKVRPASIASKS